jgi:ATP-dependent helicase STH1/SNF2
VNDDDHVPSLAKINEMIARSEEELKAFNQYDKELQERLEEECKRNGRKVPSPLMQDEELPSWVTTNDVDDIMEQQIEYGRGMRDHGNVTYDDGWIEFSSDDDETPNSSSNNISNARKRKRSGASNNRIQVIESDDADSADDLEMEEEEEEEEEEDNDENDSDGNNNSVSDFGSPQFDSTPNLAQKKKVIPASEKKRQSSTNSTPKLTKSTPRKKMKLDEADESPYAAAAPPPQNRVLQNKLLTIIDSIRTATDDGRLRSYLFEKLPSRKALPDYYTVIKKPIDLVSIKKKIDSKSYSDLKSFQTDMDLLFTNAREYNVEGSEIYNDSVSLQVCLFLL